MSLTSATRTGDKQKGRHSLGHRLGETQNCGRREKGLPHAYPSSLGELPSPVLPDTNEPGPLGLAPGTRPSGCGEDR